MNRESEQLSSIAEAYGPDKFGLSFELFPPKTEKGEGALFGHLEKLVEFRPSYVTCTYGAGGSTQDKTLDVISKVRRQLELPVATHLTCVGRTADEIGEYLSRANEADVTNVVALRGDPPAGEETFQAIEGGFSYANELVAFIRATFPQMGIAVGGYPETHQEAASPEADLQNLKRKVDAGSDVIITQLFYDNADFFEFREKCETAGITIPIVPGLLPITNLEQIKRITNLCAAKLPQGLLDDLEKHADDPQGQFEVGVNHATEQTAGLVAAQVEGIHYYVLNKSEATLRVLNSVSLPR